MILYALMIAAQHPTDGKASIYSRDYDLSSFGFFYRNTVKESFKFVCRESIALPEIEYGSRHSVTHEDQFVVHILVSSNQKVAGFAFCDQSYPKRIAFNCLNELLDSFEAKVSGWTKYTTDENLNCGVDVLLKEYKDPMKKDALIKAQGKTEEIKEVLEWNVRKLLERGENLEKMVDKSKDLSLQSKIFFKQAKKMNKPCCNIF